MAGADPQSNQVWKCRCHAEHEASARGCNADMTRHAGHRHTAELRKENTMAAVTYTKGDWHAEADIQTAANGKYQGVVLIAREGATDNDEKQYTVDAISNTPREALDEAMALAHRLLSER
jgi:hypothetical protein